MYKVRPDLVISRKIYNTIYLNGTIYFGKGEPCGSGKKYKQCCGK